MDIDKRIGDYEILGELGQGGMGRVFRVRNVISDRVEAMKVLLPDLVGRQDLAARFLREIKVLAALNHPNIAALRTALTADNQLVMIMEYVEGQSLAERLAHGPIATADALSYIDQVLDALSYAHGRGVVHRDIKPANMMLTPAGVVKLTDFGIARSTTDETITVVGTTTGSLSYMAPEQVNGEATDARSDLYSVGISLYEMVTAQRPFRADSDFHVMLAHLKEEPRPPVELQPSLPPALNGIILRSIAKAPNARFQSADGLREALRGIPAGGSSPTASRQATVLLSTSAQVALADMPVPAAEHRVPPSAQPSDHARTVLDTRTPSASPPAVPRTGPAPIPNAQAPAMRSGHPLLFVALGAALVIGALVGTGLYLGRAEAGPERSSEAVPAAPAVVDPDDVAPAEPARTAIGPGAEAAVPRPAAGAPAMTSEVAPAGVPDATGTQPRATSPTGETRSNLPPQPPSPAVPAARSGSRPGTSAPAASGAAAGSGAAAPPSPAPAAPAPPAPPPADTAELDAIEAEIDQVAARAGAVNGSLDRLKEQQARQGLGLRGDIAARQESMRINLSRAQDALDRGDAGRARKYHDAARSDIEVLERFLGR